MSRWTFRDYQLDATTSVFSSLGVEPAGPDTDQVVSHFRDAGRPAGGSKSALVVAAVGLGKTVIMGALARSWPAGRVMLMSHRFELNQQALDSLQDICGEDVDLEQADYHADQLGRRRRIVVASVQSLNSQRRLCRGGPKRYRFEKFRPNEFGLVMIDEAHHATAATYRRVVDYFRQNDDCRVVGVTATPDRLDNVGMGVVFDSVACDFNLLWGVESGWLVEPRQVFVRIEGLDLSQVRTRGGDLDGNQLAKLVEVEQTLHEMSRPIVDVCRHDQAIVFTASVAQAHRMAEMIRDYHHEVHGGDCQAVALDGSTSPQDPKRKQIVRDFKSGQIQYLVNCGVATEGFDAPNVRCIAIARPTKSRALYQQMLGRGTRPLPGTVDGACNPQDRLSSISASDKKHCTVLDFVGQAGKHKLVCSTDFMVGSQDPPEVIERARQIVSNPDWDGTTLDSIREAREKLAAEREARRAKITVGVDYQLVGQSSQYDMAFIERNQKTSLPGYVSRHAVSDKQRTMLKKLGFSESQIDGMNKRTASKAITYAIDNPRNSFGRWLKGQRSRV